MKRKIAIVLVAALCMTSMAAGCGEKEETKKEAAQSDTSEDASDTTETEEAADSAEKDGEEQASEASGEGTYKDGVYEGAGTGYGGKINVKVTVKDGKIADIEIGDHSEDAMYMDEAVAILDDVIEQQTTKVDAVSGATSSCVGILSGIKKALKQAEQ